MYLSFAFCKKLDVYCRYCSTLLLTYNKAGSGHLIKIRQHKVIDEFTKVKGQFIQVFVSLIKLRSDHVSLLNYIGHDCIRFSFCWLCVTAEG